MEYDFNFYNFRGHTLRTLVNINVTDQQREALHDAVERNNYTTLAAMTRAAWVNLDRKLVEAFDENETSR